MDGNRGILRPSSHGGVNRCRRPNGEERSTEKLEDDLRKKGVIGTRMGRIH